MKLTCLWSLLLLAETVLSLTTTSWTVPTEGLSGRIWNDRAKPDQTPSPLNATLPVALTVVAPDQFPSLSKARRAIRQQKILIEHSFDSTTAIVGKSDTRIHPGDVIRIKEQSTAQANVRVGYPDLAYSKPSGILPNIIYEDDDLAIINKLAGMICHSIDKGGYDANSVLRLAPLILTPPDASLVDDGLEWPALVHRLDTKTSGLLLLAKTRTASVSLSEQFAARQVSKTYQAIVEGRPEAQEGRIESLVDDKVAVTFYKIVKSMPTSKGVPLTWIEFSPTTGRRHQLRQHASLVLQCPIVGDTLYGSSWSNYMYLCATRISCQHPRSLQLLEVEIPAPGRFDQFWKRENGRYHGYQQWLKREKGTCAESSDY
jgi:23S rRNA pseudouridine1911/1915/1917 synthase